jgi:AcrR family transcriptional regulator
MLEEAPRVRRAERRAATTREIVDAAWSHVREHGLASLSLRDLAAAVGMRAPSLYSYFDSKHAIYDAMFLEGAEAFLEAQMGIPQSGDALTDLKAGARRFIAFCVEDPARYQLLFHRTIPGFEPSPAAYAPAVATLDDVRMRFRAMGLGSERHLDLFTAITTGLADQQISNDPGGDRWLRLIDEAIEMFHAHFAVGPDDTKPTKQPGHQKQRKRGSN